MALTIFRYICCPSYRKSAATGDGAKSGIAGMLMVISLMAAMYLAFRGRSR